MINKKKAVCGQRSNGDTDRNNKFNNNNNNYKKSKKGGSFITML